MAGSGGTFRVAVLSRNKRQSTRQMMDSDYMDCLIDFYPVDSLQEIGEKFLKVRDAYDGILTSGLFSDRIIACNNDIGISHRYVAASAENYYRQILLQLMHHPELELSRIRLDLMERGQNLAQIIESNALVTLMHDEHARVYKMNPSEVVAFEQEMLARHEWAIRHGNYQLFMTRSPIADAMFARYNVKYVYVDFTHEEVTDALKSLRKDMQLKRLKGGQIACIRLEIVREDSAEKREKLKSVLEEYQRQYKRVLSGWQERENGFLLMTDARTVDEITHVRRYSSLSGFLGSRMGREVLVGYGIGNTVQDAEENAAAAINYHRSAPMDASWAYLVDENGQVNSLDTNVVEISPGDLGKSLPSKSAGVLESTVNRIARTAHLSSRIVMHLIMALRRENRREAGSEWLIREMGVSPRTANKILSNLEKAGYAEITGRTMQVSKGRPSNIYRFRFEQEEQA